MNKFSMKNIIGIVIAMMIFALPIVNPLLAVQLGQAHSVGAWHGNTNPTSDCGGWNVDVDTTWSGYVGSIDSSSNLTGTWADGQTSANWSVTVRWATGETWSASGTVTKPSDCEPDPVDVCPNIPGDQATVPDGMQLVDGNCVEIPPQTVDVCPNIPGDQATVPDGMILKDGNCVEIPKTVCTECKQVPPQKVECIIPLGGNIISSSVKVVWVVGTDGHTHLTFTGQAEGMIANGVDLVLDHGTNAKGQENLHLVLTPRDFYGDLTRVGWWAQGCYYGSSDNWTSTPAAGPMTVGDHTDPVCAKP